MAQKQTSGCSRCTAVAATLFQGVSWSRSARNRIRSSQEWLPARFFQHAQLSWQGPAFSPFEASPTPQEQMSGNSCCTADDAMERPTTKFIRAPQVTVSAKLFQQEQD